MKFDFMDAEWYPVEELERRDQLAQAYIDRVERKRARDDNRAIRRCQKFADNLWNMALGGGVVFFAFAAILRILA